MYRIQYVSTWDNSGSKVIDNLFQIISHFGKKTTMF